MRNTLLDVDSPGSLGAAVSLRHTHLSACSPTPANRGGHLARGHAAGTKCHGARERTGVEPALPGITVPLMPDGCKLLLGSCSKSCRPSAGDRGAPRAGIAGASGRPQRLPREGHRAQTHVAGAHVGALLRQRGRRPHRGDSGRGSERI